MQLRFRKYAGLKRGYVRVQPMRVLRKDSEVAILRGPLVFSQGDLSFDTLPELKDLLRLIALLL